MVGGCDRGLHVCRFERVVFTPLDSFGYMVTMDVHGHMAAAYCAERDRFRQRHRLRGDAGSSTEPKASRHAVHSSGGKGAPWPSAQDEVATGYPAPHMQPGLSADGSPPDVAGKGERCEACCVLDEAEEAELAMHRGIYARLGMLRPKYLLFGKRQQAPKGRHMELQVRSLCKA